MRSGQSYQKLVETVKLFHSMRGHLQYPFLHITTTVTYESPYMIQVFKEEVMPYVDSVQVGNTNLSRVNTDIMQVSEELKKMFTKLKKSESVNKKYARCVEVYEKLSINYDGSVSACCGDYDNLMIVGNLNEATLKDIYHNSQELKQYRKMLDEYKHGMLPLCKSCYPPINLKP